MNDEECDGLRRASYAAVNLEDRQKFGSVAPVRTLVLGSMAGWLFAGCGAAASSTAAPASWGASEAPIPAAWNPRDAGLAGLPGGATCLQWLSTLGISYRELSDLRGVDTPVEVTGPIAGVTYSTAGKVSVVGDCRLILALDWSGRTLTRVGVSAVRHSGAYVYRTTSRGRPSLHARGLALDVHALYVAGTWYDVERHYARGRGPVCDSLQPFVNHVYCRLSQLNLFRELITPDHNAEHHDHFHLGVASAH